MAREIDLPQLFQLVVFENRPLQGDLAAARRLGLQQIALGTDLGLGRGNQFLAQRVERGISNLSEVLLEVVVEELRPLRQRRQRRVVAHRADRVLEHLDHRLEEDAQILKRIAKSLLPVEHVLVAI